MIANFSEKVGDGLSFCDFGWENGVKRAEIAIWRDKLTQESYRQADFRQKQGDSSWLIVE
jgi:hypothetical protein